MDRIDRPTFVLPEGDYADTAWIPDLLAKARWLDDDSPKTVTYCWVPNDGFGLTPMSETDEALLRDIWKGLPALVFPMTLEAWQPYADAFNRAIARPERGLRWNVNDPQYNVRMKRAVVKGDYQKLLAAAIEDGTLEVRSEGTLAVVPPPASGTRKLLATREAIGRFVERVGFKVVDNPPPETSLSQAPESIDPRRKSTYLLVIRMLLEKAGMGQQQRNEAKAIAQALAKLKLTALDRKTIADVLKEARALK